MDAEGMQATHNYWSVPVHMHMANIWPCSSDTGFLVEGLVPLQWYFITNKLRSSLTLVFIYSDRRGGGDSCSVESS